MIELSERFEAIVAATIESKEYFATIFLQSASQPFEEQDSENLDWLVDHRTIINTTISPILRKKFDIYNIIFLACCAKIANIHQCYEMKGSTGLHPLDVENTNKKNQFYFKYLEKMLQANLDVDLMRNAAEEILKKNPLFDPRTWLTAYLPSQKSCNTILKNNNQFIIFRSIQWLTTCFSSQKSCNTMLKNNDQFITFFRLIQQYFSASHLIPYLKTSLKIRGYTLEHLDVSLLSDNCVEDLNKWFGTTAEITLSNWFNKVAAQHRNTKYEDPIDEEIANYFVANFSVDMIQERKKNCLKEIKTLHQKLQGRSKLIQFKRLLEIRFSDTRHPFFKSANDVLQSQYYFQNQNTNQQDHTLRKL